MVTMTLSRAAAVVASCVMLGAAGGACAVHADPAKDGFGELTLDQVEQAIAKKEAITIIDNNSRDRWAQGHVPGAKWMESSGIKAAELPADKGAKLVFYCSNPG